MYEFLAEQMMLLTHAVFEFDVGFCWFIESGIFSSKI